MSKLKGGFIGVDVFFVISGFLVTSVIYNQIKAGSFNLSNFFLRRIFRLLPVFFAVLLSVCITAVFLLKPTQFPSFGYAVKYASLGFANLSFLKFSTDYFEQSGLQENPILHLWSLSVEEQFYFLFPLLIMGVFQICKKRNYHFEQKLVVGLLLLLGLSFGYSIYLYYLDKNTAFFVFSSRAWELIAGALLALTLDKLPKLSTNLKYEICWLVSIVGLVIFSFTFEHKYFPGFLVVAPAVFTLAALYSGNMFESKLKGILVNNYTVFIGLISYSLYMWHWPVLAFARSGLTNFWGLGRFSGGYLLILIFVLSIVSWSLIERPFRIRNITTVTKTAGFSFLVISVVFFQFLSAELMRANQIGSIIQQKFLPKDHMDLIPLPSEVPYRKWEVSYRDIEDIAAGSGGRLIGAKEQVPDVLILGDSYAGMWGDGLDSYLRTKNKSAVLISVQACMFLLDLTKKDNSQCNELNKAREKYIKNSNIKKIVLASNWKSYLSYELSGADETSAEAKLYSYLHVTVQELRKLDKEVYILAPVVPLATDPYEILEKSAHLLGEDEVAGRKLDQYLSLPEMQVVTNSLDRIRQKFAVQLIDPNTFRCSSGQCNDTIDKKIVLHNSDHLNAYGSTVLAKSFEVVFN